MHSVSNQLSDQSCTEPLSRTREFSIRNQVINAESARNRLEVAARPTLEAEIGSCTETIFGDQN